MSLTCYFALKHQTNKVTECFFTEQKPTRKTAPF